MRITFPGALFLIFLTLKLGGVPPVSEWSWVWVAAPLWVYWGWVLLIMTLLLWSGRMLKKAKQRLNSRDF